MIILILMFFIHYSTTSEIRFEDVEDERDLMYLIKELMEEVHPQENTINIDNTTFENLVYQSVNLELPGITNDSTMIIIRQELMRRINWTDCFQFVNSSTMFDENALLENVWRAYLIWSDGSVHGRGPVFKFLTPTDLDKQTFSKEFRKVKGIDWSKAELRLETNFDLSMLLFRTNISGWYGALIMTTYLQHIRDYQREIRSVGLKFYKNGHLAVMNCKERLMFLFAPIEQFPKTSEEVEELSAMVDFKTDIPPQRCLDSDLRKHFTPHKMTEEYLKQFDPPNQTEPEPIINQKPVGIFD